jgi:murein DD-endopeptidase MepM/ murein hydrolase activator NlpD
VRVVLRRPVLTAAVVVATAATTAAASMPAPSAAPPKAHPTRVAGVATQADAVTAAAGSPAASVLDQRSERRVSRNKRTALSRPHKPAMKPGQTVAGRWVLPAPGVMTTCFCMRWGVMHEGIDIAKGYGVPIRAVGDGVVLKAGPSEGFGNWVVIQHSNGDVSIYGHMESYSVRVGEHIKAGQIIAHEGSMGFSTGPHLHFEVHRGGFDGPPIDPVPWLRARGVIVPTYDPNG